MRQQDLSGLLARPPWNGNQNKLHKTHLTFPYISSISLKYSEVAMLKLGGADDTSTQLRRQAAAWALLHRAVLKMVAQAVHLHAAKHAATRLSRLSSHRNRSSNIFDIF
jgi:hypothetical protein